MQFLQFTFRALQFLWTLLTTALIGNVIASAFAGNPSSINYAIFVSTFSWIVLLYGLIAWFVEGLAITVVLWVLDGLAAAFTFIAGVVLAARLNVHSCNNEAYLKSNSLTNGSSNMAKRCHELQASTAFYWFLWAAYMGSIVATFMNRNSAGSFSRGRGGVRKGGPSMSQV